MKNKSTNEFIVQLCAVYWQCVTWLLDNKTPSCKQAKLFTATLDQALKITDELMAARQRRQLQRLCPSSGAKLMEVHYDKKRWDEIVKIPYWSQIAGPGLQSYSHKTEKVLLNLGWINKISKVAPSTSAVKSYHLHQVNYCSTPLFSSSLKQRKFSPLPVIHLVCLGEPIATYQINPSALSSW